MKQHIFSGSRGKQAFASVFDVSALADWAASLGRVFRLLAAQFGGLALWGVVLAARDMSETNYSSARQGMIEDDLTYTEEVELLQGKFMVEVYETFLISAVLAGKLTIPDFWNDPQKYMATQNRFRHLPKWALPFRNAGSSAKMPARWQKRWERSANRAIGCRMI